MLITYLFISHSQILYLAVLEEHSLFRLTWDDSLAFWPWSSTFRELDFSNFSVSTLWTDTQTVK